MAQGYTGPGSAPPPKKETKGGPPAGLAGGVAEASRKARMARHLREKGLRVPPMEAISKPITGRYGSPPSMRKGGLVRKTGLIKMHKGERVTPAKRGMKMSRRGGY